MKDFDAWNSKKKYVDQKSSVIGVHEREIWWVSLGLNIGVEINGKHEEFERPVLIIKSFNREMAWVLPTTLQDKDTIFHEKIIFQRRQYYVALTQIRTLSTKRFLRKTGMIPKEDFRRVIKRIISFLHTNEDPL